MFDAWDRLEVGGVIINDVPSYRVDNMPYGGVKDSGLGREGIRFAMEDMTEIRNLVIRRRRRSQHISAPEASLFPLGIARAGPSEYRRWIRQGAQRSRSSGPDAVGHNPDPKPHRSAKVGGVGNLWLEVSHDSRCSHFRRQ